MRLISETLIIYQIYSIKRIYLCKLYLIEQYGGIKSKKQFKLLGLAERETEKIIVRNRISEIERHLNHVKKKLEMI